MIDIINTKICSKCREEKDISKFYKQPKNTKTGLHSWCKKCISENRQKRYNEFHKPKEYIRKRQPKIKTGDKFGIVTVINEPYRCQRGNDEGFLVAKCRCECGNIFTKRCSFLISRYNPTKSCGRCQKQKYFVNQGDIFDNLTVITDPFLVNLHTRNSHSEVKCQCKCGSIISVEPRTLIKGQKSCQKCSWQLNPRDPPKNIVHNLYYHRIYGIWRNMIARCYNSKHISYRYYGKKGIRVCDEWKNSVTTFWEWAKTHEYEDNLTIHRINSNENYSPENCKWITSGENTKIANQERKERLIKMKKQNEFLLKENQELKQKVIDLNKLL